MKNRIVEFFRINAPDHDPAALAESVLGIIEHRRKLEAQKRLEQEAITKALKKVDQAITVLEKTKGQQSESLLESLQTARFEAGDVRERHTVTTSLIHIGGPGFDQVQTISSEVTSGAKNAGLIFDLESFWFRTFGERPSEYRDHKFFTLAAIVCPGTGGRELEAASVYEQRKRAAPPVPTIGDK